MRSSRRARNIAVAFCIAGALLAPASFLLAHVVGDTAHTVLFIGGLTAFMFGGAAALFHHGQALSPDRLTGDEDVVARWTVDSDTWRDFMTLEEELRGAAGERGNELGIARDLPPQAVQVVVGAQSVQVGDQRHSFAVPGHPAIEYVRRVTAYPAYLELGLYRADASFPRDNCLRFPYPAPAKGEAKRVQQHYEAFEAKRAGGAPIAIRNPRTIYVVALSMLLVAVLVAGYGYLNYRPGDRLMAGLAMGGAAVAGAMILVLTIVYLFRWVQLRGEADR